MKVLKQYIAPAVTVINIDAEELLTESREVPISKEPWEEDWD